MSDPVYTFLLHWHILVSDTFLFQGCQVSSCFHPQSLLVCASIVSCCRKHSHIYRQLQVILVYMVQEPLPQTNPQMLFHFMQLHVLWWTSQCELAREHWVLRWHKKLWLFNLRSNYSKPYGERFPSLLSHSFDLHVRSMHHRISPAQYISVCASRQLIACWPQNAELFL